LSCRLPASGVDLAQAGMESSSIGPQLGTQRVHPPPPFPYPLAGGPKPGAGLCSQRAAQGPCHISVFQREPLHEIVGIRSQFTDTHADPAHGVAGAADELLRLSLTRFLRCQARAPRSIQLSP